MSIEMALFSGVLCAALVGCAAAEASALSIVPKPVEVDRSRANFTVDGETQILFGAANAELEKVADYLASVLRPATGLPLPVAATAEKEAHENNSLLSLVEDDGELGREGYRLEVCRKGVDIAAPHAAGLFYGIQTLRQLLPPQVFSETPVEGQQWTVPCVRVRDYPRFAWRGLLLDVARHFMPKEFVKKFIDTMALHKMNSLQLHLTDDQGWRVEIKKYPKLTEVGAWRSETVAGHVRATPQRFDGIRHGGFYTQEDIRELVAYAAERHVNLVPEIEMPGHAQSAIAAYPELGNTGEQLPVLTYWGVNPNIFNANESTILFLQDVLAEVIQLFPSPYIHIGGDEAVKDQWKASPTLQARIKELGLANETEMQRYFIGRMHNFLDEKGRRLFGWDEILDGGLSSGAVVMAWRGVDKAVQAARAGHDVVMAPTKFTYFDYYQGKRESEPLAIGGYLPLKRVYSFNPMPEELSEEEGKHILGAQGQLWSEYIKTPEHVEYMAFPRACALAEVAWTPQKDRDYDTFLKSLETHFQRLESLGVGYRELKSK